MYISMNLNKLFMLLCIVFFSLAVIPFLLNLFHIRYRHEGYSNYQLEQAMGDVPAAQTEVLVQDTYPRIPLNQEVAKESHSAENIWQNYPVFALGSYEQITNNIKYPKNPDDGTCMPASMCGVLYRDAHLGKNEIEPLPPADNTGTRIGYFTSSTHSQLTDSLPYDTYSPNVLY